MTPNEWIESNKTKRGAGKGYGYGSGVCYYNDFGYGSSSGKTTGR